MSTPMRKRGRALPAASALALAVASILLASHASAQKATVDMSATRTDLAVGDTFRLTVRAEVTGSGVRDVQMPDLSAFRVRSRHVSRPMQFRFGFGGKQQVVQATNVYRYTLEATEPGTYELGPAHVRAGGQRFESNTLTIRVHDASGNVPGGSSSDPDTQDSSDSSDTSLEPPPGAEDVQPGLDGANYDPKAFLRTVVDKAEPWVREQVTVTLYLYVRGGLRSAPVISKEPSTAGFWIHDLLPPQRNLEASRQVVRGHTYRVYVLRRFAAFPIKTGELTIGAMEVDLKPGSLFDLFDGRAQNKLHREGVPVTLDVKPLPDSDRADVPVGKYELEAKLDRKEVQTGGAVTLTATARGTGNVRDVQLELDEMKGVRVLQPETRDDIEAPGDLVRGTRTVEWLLVPEEPGDHTLPALNLTYFNPSTESYEQATAEPPTLVAAGKPVAARSNDGSPQDAEPSGDSGGGDPRGELGPIRTESALSRDRRVPAHAQPWYPLALAFPPLAWLGAVATRFARRRLAQRHHASAPRRAARQARRRLAQAEQHAKQGEPRPFYAEIAQALKTMLEARLGEPTGGLTYDQLRSHLRTRGMDDDLAQRLTDELEGGDFARFSAAGVSSDEMSRCVQRTEALLDRLERFQPTEPEGEAA